MALLTVTRILPGSIKLNDDEAPATEFVNDATFSSAGSKTNSKSTAATF